MSKNSQLRTIMSVGDETEFLDFASNLVDRIDKDCDSEYFLCKGECTIQFLRSSNKNGVLLSGRIAVSSDMKDIVKVYGQLQRWIKKHYFNNLTVRNINIIDSKRSCKNVWLGSCAKKLTLESNVVLSQGIQGIVVFEIEQP